ncbi:MAG: thioredoxin family protein [Candidatus Acidiferrales bacterium]
MRMFRVSLLLLGSFLSSVLFAQKPPAADQVLRDAKAQAEQQHKLIFLVFSASWCGPCHQLDAFLDASEIRPIVEKYFVLTKLSVAENAGKHPELESPGGEELDARFGGADEKGGVTGVPFLVFLDAKGELIVNSNRPVQGHPEGDNIGYPAAPYEIDWFMAMLKKAVPEMTPDESRTIEKWLRKASAK